MVLSLFCLLALATPPAPNDPSALLLSASAHELQPARCADAMDMYARFFETCTSCDLYAYGQQRFDVALDRCTMATTPAVYATGEDVNPADATQVELFEMARRVLELDQKAAAELVAATLRVSPSPAAYNALRLRAFEVLDRRDPTLGEVESLIRRLNSSDVGFTRALERQLRTPDNLYAVRKHVIERLIERSTPASLEPIVENTCRHDDAEQGYLTINTKPWAQIFVNDELIGETPLSRVKLPSGCVRVRAVDPKTGRERTESVKIRPNKVQIVSFTIE